VQSGAQEDEEDVGKEKVLSWNIEYSSSENNLDEIYHE
jgi:hypothetical protein